VAQNPIDVRNSAIARAIAVARAVGRRRLTRPEAKRVADKHRRPQPFHIGAPKRKEHSMALSLHDITVGGRRNSLLDTLRGYFVRYRMALYLLSGAAVALGVVLNWNWLTAAGLLRIVLVLPCALMMFRCIRPATRG
jgi:hypothetical protein